MTYSALALRACLILGPLMLYLGTRKRRCKWNATSYDWRRDSQWRSWM